MKSELKTVCRKGFKFKANLTVRFSFQVSFNFWVFCSALSTMPAVAFTKAKGTVTQKTEKERIKFKVKVRKKILLGS